MIKRLRLSRARLLGLVCLVQLANCALCLLFMLRCPGPELAMVEAGAACNAGCGCEAGDIDLVCGSDGLMYLSPCLAGCAASSGQIKHIHHHHNPVSSIEYICSKCRLRKLHRLCLHHRSNIHGGQGNVQDRL